MDTNNPIDTPTTSSQGTPNNMIYFVSQKIVALEFTPYKGDVNIDPLKTGVHTLSGYEDYKKFTTTLENFLQSQGLLQIVEKGTFTTAKSKEFLTALMGTAPNDIIVDSHVSLTNQKDVAAMRIIKSHVSAQILPSLINYKTSMEIYNHLNTVYGVRADEARRMAKSALFGIQMKYDETKKRVLETLPEYVDRLIAAKNLYAHWSDDNSNSNEKFTPEREIEFLLEAMSKCWPQYTQSLRKDYVKLGSTAADKDLAELYDTIKREDQKEPSYRDHLKGKKQVNIVSNKQKVGTDSPGSPKPKSNGNGSRKGGDKKKQLPKPAGTKKNNSDSTCCAICTDAKFKKCIQCHLCDEHGHYKANCKSTDDPEIVKLVKAHISKKQKNAKKAVNTIQMDVDDDDETDSSTSSSTPTDSRKRKAKQKSVHVVDSPRLNQGFSSLQLEGEEMPGNLQAGRPQY